MNKNLMLLVFRLLPIFKQSVEQNKTYFLLISVTDSKDILILRTNKGIYLKIHDCELCNVRKSFSHF